MNSTFPKIELFDFKAFAVAAGYKEKPGKVLMVINQGENH